jgi:hypothetical protein
MRTLADLDASLDHVRGSPRDTGTIELIVLRTSEGQRSVVETAELDVAHGMVGDRWATKGSRHTPDGSPNLEQQLTLMNVRAIAAITERERWPLAGDQLFVDFDLSEANLPAGTRLQIGEVVVEISALPHTGCAKFSGWYGTDATKWVNTGTGRELRLRGVNARIVRGGVVRRGDSLSKRSLG